MRANLFGYLFKIFVHIEHLEFYAGLWKDAVYVHFVYSPSMFSSTLVELHINPYPFKDLRYLLDGRFDHLRKLIVNLLHMWRVHPVSVGTFIDTVRQNQQAMSIDRLRRLFL